MKSAQKFWKRWANKIKQSLLSNFKVIVGVRTKNMRVQLYMVQMTSTKFQIN